MPITKVQLSGGNFQDAEGSLLSGGYLTFILNQDGVVNTSQICAGIKVTVNLDGYGSVIAGQYVWGNDQLSPVNSYYKVTGYKANGQQAFGPNNQQVLGNGGTFDVGTWVPNLVTSWTPALQPLSLKTNGVANGNQFLLNLNQGSNITLTDNGSGQVTVAATAAVPTIHRPVWSCENFEFYPEISPSGIGPGGSDGQIWSYPLVINTPVYIAKILARAATGSIAARTFTVGIYSMDGATRYVYAGDAAFNGAVYTEQTVSITPVTLPAGQYMVVYGNTNATQYYNYSFSGVSYDHVNAGGQLNWVTWSASMTGGALPATLGTATGATISAQPAFLFLPA